MVMSLPSVVISPLTGLALHTIPLRVKYKQRAFGAMILSEYLSTDANSH